MGGPSDANAESRPAPVSVSRLLIGGCGSLDPSTKPETEQAPQEPGQCKPDPGDR